MVKNQYLRFEEGISGIIKPKFYRKDVADKYGSFFRVFWPNFRHT